MQEFSSISVSSYEAGSLAQQLTEQSRDGWSVVAIVPTGSTVTAYLARDTDGVSTESAAEPAAEPAVEPAPEPSPEPSAAGWGAVSAEPETSVPDVAAEPAPEPAPGEIVPEPAAEGTSTVAASTAGAAPAGWYADPSGRFELRYWDGGQWTEHVSRAGQQYTDPPVA